MATYEGQKHRTALWRQRMKFLIDAQLPRQLAFELNLAGHDARHTLTLPNANASEDEELLEIATTEERIIITKDSDFRDSYLLRKQPRHLLLITTGNISNAALLALVFKHFGQIIKAFEIHSFLELSRDNLIIHD
jgi:predicted nuclease of predicted toxin-antitoxin system